jgi:hypothetical protein
MILPSLSCIIMKYLLMKNDARVRVIKHTAKKKPPAGVQAAVREMGRKNYSW